MLPNNWRGLLMECLLLFPNYSSRMTVFSFRNRIKFVIVDKRNNLYSNVRTGKGFLEWLDSVLYHFNGSLRDIIPMA